MTRVGWAMLVVIVAGLAAFGATLTVGGSPPGLRAARAAPARTSSTPRADLPVDLAVVPVPGVTRGELRDSWGEAREGGARAHHGTDIPAASGTAVIAVAPGRVEKLFTSARGGTCVYQRSRDGRWIYYYAHLAGYAPGLREGRALGPGDPIGFVGDTGDAGPGNFHLHFGLSRVGPGQGWWQGEDVDPYPWLAGRAGPR